MFNKVNLSQKRSYLTILTQKPALRTFELHGADPLDCSRSIIALQIVMCMALDLSVESAITSAHTSINSAAAGALWMGLHQVHAFGHSPLGERLLRERVYPSLKALDIYTFTFLGLPCYMPACSDSGQDRHDSPFLYRNIQSDIVGVFVEASVAC